MALVCVVVFDDHVAVVRRFDNAEKAAAFVAAHGGEVCTEDEAARLAGWSSDTDALDARGDRVAS